MMYAPDALTAESFDPNGLHGGVVAKTAVPALIYVLDRARGVMERQSALAARLGEVADNLLGSEPAPAPDQVPHIPSPPCGGMVGGVADSLEHMVNALNRLEQTVARLEQAIA